jgi:hypothetical protein
MSMPDALLVTVLVALPGALFTFAYERETQIVRAAPSDRVVRLTTASAVFYVATAPLSYLLYVKYVRTRRPATGPLPWAIWLVPIGLVVCPVGLGLVLGAATHRGTTWARLWSGRSPEPLAWDAAFGHGADAWPCIRLKDPSGGTDGCLLGAFGPGSHGHHSLASSYPNPPDLYLSETAEAEPVMGNFGLDELSRRVRAGRKLAAKDDCGTWYLLNWRMEASTAPILPKLHRVGGPDDPG